MKTRRLHRGMQPAGQCDLGALAFHASGLRPLQLRTGLRPGTILPAQLPRLRRTRGRAHRALHYASAPIGSQAGREMADSSRAFWYSSGSMLLGTATSYTNSVNQSSLIVK